jgi:hypothetical protein
MKFYAIVVPPVIQCYHKKNLRETRCVMKKIAFLVMLVAAVGLAFCLLQKRPTLNHTLFSWQSQAMSSDERETMFETMEAYDLTVLAQHIPDTAPPELIRSFLEEASAHKISVYLLTGDPSWGLDPNGCEMIAEVQRAAKIKETLDLKGSLIGVMMDTEPYLTTAWQDDRRGTLLRYVSGMKASYSEAQQKGLLMTACIPYFYDTDHLEDLLQQLISQCCDGIAVMNYAQGKEAEHLETEFSLAKRYQKSLITIYELQPPGVFDLQEENTYYDDGLGAVFENYATLKQRLSDQTVSFGFHEYTALLELTKKGQKNRSIFHNFTTAFRSKQQTST